LGSISFGLVSIPVRLAFATEKKDLAFHLLHRKDGSRVKQRYFCAADAQPLELEDLARGYEVSPRRNLLIRDEDFEGIPVSSPKSIDIAEFVQLSEVDPALFQRTYYLEPEEVGVKPYVLLLQPLKDSGRVALGRFTGAKSTSALSVL
jgi:DNA end-binding protein Ku